MNHRRNNPAKSQGLVFLCLSLIAMTRTVTIPVFWVSLTSPVLAQIQSDRKAETDRLIQQGIQQYQTNQYPAAIESWEKALTIFQEIGDRPSEAKVLYNLGGVYENLGQHSKALEYYQQALPITREVNDRNGEGITLHGFGFVHWNQGQYPQALEYYQQALPIFQEVKNRSWEGFTFNNIGAVYDKLGNYAKALEYYQKALPIKRELRDLAGEGNILNNIGLVYRNLGQYPDALDSFQQALAIIEKAVDRLVEGRILNNMGGVYHSQGQYSQALKYYQQALTIFQELPDRTGEGITRSNMGEIYQELGQYPDALKYYQQALAILQEVGDRAGEGKTLNNIGLVYRSQEQYPKALEKALEYYKQALTIFQELPDRTGEGKTLNNIGAVYGNMRDYPKALEYYQQALTIEREMNDRTGEGKTLNNIGEIYRNRGEYPKALESYQQALGIIQKVGAPAEEGIILNNIGGLYGNIREYEKAERYLFDAVKVFESVRRQDLTDTDKVSIFERQTSSYRMLQEVLIAQQKMNQALEIAERGRARAFVELLARKISDNPDKQPSPESPSIQQIQKIAKEQNATLVEYSIVGENNDLNLYIWVVQPTGKVEFRQVNLQQFFNTSLENFVTSTRQSIGVRGRSSIEVVPLDDSEAKNQLKQLHKLLIEPIADLLPSDPNAHVIFMPQGELFLVPFPALQDENGKYLIEKHTILTAPAIQVLDLTQKQRVKVQQANPKGLVVVGNPTMPKVTFKIGEPPEQLNPLPAAENEAITIAKLLNTKALTGNQATKKAILSQLPQARIIHLATHGLLDDFKGLGVPGAIALAPSGNDDGLLTADEILNLKLNAELVVLSACDTGRGRITGDGVIGLSRSLITAGVPSIIVSLWSVPDAPTASLMTEFYRNWQEKKLDKAQALRQAMLTTMKNHPNPKDWAAFTLIGEAE